MIIFSSPSKCPYLNAFPPSFTNWSSYDSSLIYLATGSSPLTINSMTADGASVTGWAWWQTGTSWVTGWPITIPPEQNAVIQVNQQASNITLQTSNGPISLSVTDGWQDPLTTESPSEIPTTLITPDAGNYLLAINVATGIGYGDFSVNIDSQSFSVNINSQEQGPVFAYKYIGPIESGCWFPHYSDIRRNHFYSPNRRHDTIFFEKWRIIRKRRQLAFFPTEQRFGYLQRNQPNPIYSSG